LPEEAGGKWGEAVNLGPAVNTAGNERTPVIGEDSYLYFFSDGRVGMGGLDIYRAGLKDGRISGAENLGYPINSPSG
jgi:hypothetical protein